jgi:hypothetical protein
MPGEKPAVEVNDIFHGVQYRGCGVDDSIANAGVSESDLDSHQDPGIILIAEGTQVGMNLERIARFSNEGDFCGDLAPATGRRKQCPLTTGSSGPDQGNGTVDEGFFRPAKKFREGSGYGNEDSIGIHNSHLTCSVLEKFASNPILSMQQAGFPVGRRGEALLQGFQNSALARAQVDLIGECMVPAHADPMMFRSGKEGASMMGKQGFRMVCPPGFGGFYQKKVFIGSLVLAAGGFHLPFSQIGLAGSNHPVCPGDTEGRVGCKAKDFGFD